MYHSPVPLIVIRCGERSLVEVNGQPLGECAAGAHVALPAGDAGEYYISFIPLDAGSRCAVTRKVTIENGEARADASDVSMCAWPGGVYEFCMDEAAAGAASPASETLDQLSYSIGRERRTLTLYYDGGLKLLVEDGERAAAGISVGAARYGSLALYEVSARKFAAVLTTCERGEGLLLLDEELRPALELAAERILLEESCIYAIDGLDTLMGHQSRAKYVFSGGQFSAEPPETGFFTREYARPASERELPTAFCEAVRLGLRAEAESYLSPALKAEFRFDEIKDFLGNFQYCRLPLSDKSGALLGLVARERGNVSSARLYEFTFENGLIADLCEV